MRSGPRVLGFSFQSRIELNQTHVLLFHSCSPLHTIELRHLHTATYLASPSFPTRSQMDLHREPSIIHLTHYSSCFAQRMITVDRQLDRRKRSPYQLTFVARTLDALVSCERDENKSKRGAILGSHVSASSGRVTPILGLALVDQGGGSERGLPSRYTAIRAG